jgi:hypothetical protein
MKAKQNSQIELLKIEKVNSEQLTKARGKKGARFFNSLFNFSLLNGTLFAVVVYFFRRTKELQCFLKQNKEIIVQRSN